MVYGFTSTSILASQFLLESLLILFNTEKSIKWIEPLLLYDFGCLHENTVSQIIRSIIGSIICISNNSTSSLVIIMSVYRNGICFTRAYMPATCSNYFSLLKCFILAIVDNMEEKATDSRAFKISVTLKNIIDGIVKKAISSVILIT
jgi:hypothetical protein